MNKLLSKDTLRNTGILTGTAIGYMLLRKTLNKTNPDHPIRVNYASIANSPFALVAIRIYDLDINGTDFLLDNISEFLNCSSQPSGASGFLANRKASEIASIMEYMKNEGLKSRDPRDVRKMVIFEKDDIPVVNDILESLLRNMLLT